MPTDTRRFFCLALFGLLAAICNDSTALAQSAPALPPASVQLVITGDVEKPLSLSGSDLEHLSRTTIKVMNSHDGKDETYEGVLLAEVLKQAGVPQGAKLNGKALATYVEVEGADGYRVILISGPLVGFECCGRSKSRGSRIKLLNPDPSASLGKPSPRSRTSTRAASVRIAPAVNWSTYS